MSEPTSGPSATRREALAAAGLLGVGLVAARADDAAAPATRAANDSNQKVAQPPRVEKSYPLADDAAREKSVKLLQQFTVDLLSLFNMYKQAHWNLNGPLYLILHEYYQLQANFYRKQADLFAERVLHLGYSVDGRYSTVAKTSKIPDFPAGYDTDTETLQLLVDRVTAFQKLVYAGIKATDESDAPTSNKLQDLAYEVDKNLWQLRVHVAKPGGGGDTLPYTPQQGRDRSAGPS